MVLAWQDAARGRCGALPSDTNDNPSMADGSQRPNEMEGGGEGGRSGAHDATRHAQLNRHICCHLKELSMSQHTNALCDLSSTLQEQQFTRAADAAHALAGAAGAWIDRRQIVQKHEKGEARGVGARVMVYHWLYDLLIS